MSVGSGGGAEGPYEMHARLRTEVSGVTLTTSAGEELDMPLYECPAFPEVRFATLVLPRDSRLAAVLRCKR
jgi:hypothetical protein